MLKFSGYQKFVIAFLAFLQFTVVLDFMILSPLGAILLDTLDITTTQFGLLVSVYAFSAGISGILVAGVADKFDRKKLMMFFYSGFLLGTMLCGIAPNYHLLLMARIITGIFGGVIASISFAIIADLFPFEQRGRVMGFVQTAFGASQVLGIPIGLFLATHLGWHSPFILIVAIGALVWILLFFKMKPIREHLQHQTQGHPIRNLWNTGSKPRNLLGFSATILLTTGGFMLMPLGSTFTVHNLGIPLEHVPLVYMLTGISSLVTGPYLGKLSDRLGKFPMFLAGTIISGIMVLYYTRLGMTPLYGVVAINVIMFIGINSRVISASALTSAVPEPRERGAYMSINSSVQQLAGGIAAYFAGTLVFQRPDGFLEHYERLGYVVASTMFIVLFLIRKIDQMVARSAN